MRVTVGCGLQSSTLRDLLEGSYTGDAPEGWSLDANNSSDTSKIFKHNNSDQVVVAHKGTEGFADWGNNLAYGLGGEMLYEATPRFREARNVQDAAVKEYGSDRITTIGHSQGGLQAELLGKLGRETITVNKATRPTNPLWIPSKKKSQFDIRSTFDPVSMWRSPFGKRQKNNVSIPAKSHSALKEHSYDILHRIPPETIIGDEMYGNGIYKISSRTKSQAKKLGVNVKPSQKKNKKVDVYKDDKLVASVGSRGMEDYASHMQKKGKAFADERRKAYKDRHAKNRSVVGSPGYYADKLLW